MAITCQLGAEGALKAELARDFPAWRFAFSRPGFVTYKLPAGEPFIHAPPSTFSRAWSCHLGRLDLRDEASAPSSAAAAFWQVVREQSPEAANLLPAVGEVARAPCDASVCGYVHVWSRDAGVPGDRGYEPHVDAESHRVAAELAAAGRQLGYGGAEGELAPAGICANAAAPLGTLVLDCIRVEPHSWWIGWHRPADVLSQYPGGMLPLTLPAHAVSRAYLKMHEALAWSQLPCRAGELCAEIGSAPGGSCQALLERGLRVMGIDPAEMAPAVLAHPRFVHVRKRSKEVRRREFRGVDWLMADANVAPNYTLDAVEAIVMHPEVRIRGLLLTLKLPDWELAAHIPAYLERVRSWGYALVRGRQLAHNAQEICVQAQRASPSMRSVR